MKKYLRGIPEKITEAYPPEGIGYFCLLRDIEKKENLPAEEILQSWETLLKAPLDSLLETLSGGDRRAVRMRYGLDDGQVNRSFEDIGQVCHKSADRMRQIVDKGLEKLRHPDYIWYLDALYDNKEGINIKDASERLVEARGLYLRKTDKRTPGASASEKLLQIFQ